ncbi:hypothetical protein BEH94_07785 [Candidatus Altiarchaeales archaeon WOR_SM1_SCG]|nr:hypothetical protein BEH94_07785 [Candidatus Altiarchaeales archaeon WOR_SM1_SCG]
MINEIIERVNNLSIKQQLIGIGLIILLTDLLIIFDVPILRQVFGFLCFTLIPGFMIVAILRLDKPGFAEKFVLSVGLSVAFLMFAGLLINEVCYAFGYKTPLSTYSLTISFSLIVFGLPYLAYKRNRDKKFTIPRLKLKNKIERLMFLIPLIFPALSVLGMYLMNTRDNNIILMFLYFLIPLYIILIAFLKDKIPKKVYPLAVLMISISLLLMQSLKSNYLLGMDIHAEHYIAQTIASLMYWDISYFRNTLIACLSVGILPPIYHSLSGISVNYVFKIFYPLIYSIVPLIVYLISKRYVGTFYAFLASFFYMSQMIFILQGLDPVRTGLAVFFVGLCLFVFFNENIPNTKKRIMFIIFLVSIVFSHYSTTYMFFIVLLISLITILFIKGIKRFNLNTALTFTVILLFFTVIFFWYGQLTEVPFTSGVGFVRNTIINLNNLFVEELRTEAQLDVVTGKHVSMAVPYKISYITHMITFFFVGIGTLAIVYSMLKGSKKFSTDYTIISLVMLIATFFTLMIPFYGYSNQRTYMVALLLLSLMFFIGGNTILKFFNKKISFWLIFSILILQFICASYLIFQIFGIPYSVILNSEGYDYNYYYNHEEEMVSSMWLKDNKEEEIGIYGDYLCYAKTGDIGLGCNTRFFKGNKTINQGYIYLRFRNIEEKKIMLGSGYEEIMSRDITDYHHLFTNKNEIYNNRGSEIYR